LFLAASLAAGCKRAAPPAPPPLSVEPSACSAVLAGPVCEIDGPRTIRVRVTTAPGASIRAQVEAQPQPEPARAASGEALIALDVTEGARAVVVEVEAGGARATRRLPIAVRRAPPALAEARALRGAGKPAEAAAKLEALRGDPDPLVRQQATRALARVERDLGHGDAARARFAEAIRLDGERGRPSDEVDDRLAYGYALLYDGRRFQEARETLAPAAALASAYPDGRARVPYFLGLLEYEAGNLREALRLFGTAAAASAELGLGAERIDALAALADTLAILGRPAEASERLREAQEALPPDAPPCRRAELANNVAWTALRAPLSTSADPAALLRAAADLYREACHAPAARSNALTNLALAELSRGHAGAARAALDEARAAAPEADARVRVVWRTLEARMALAEGRAEEAQRLYDEVSTLGAEARIPEARLDGALGRARALEALGRVDAARAAYEDADAQLDAWGRLVPLGEGKDTFVARWKQAARDRVDFLARTGTAADAAAAARRSRARILAALAWMDRPGALAPERRGPWESALAAYRKARAELDARAAADVFLPGDRQAAAVAQRRADQEALTAALERALAELGPPPEAHGGDLPAPAEGELLLVYHPLREGWACFAVDAQRARAVRLGDVDLRAPPADLAARLLGPVRAEIARAKRLRVAAYGDLARVDVHALPWEGRPLLATLPVIYGLDLPPTAASGAGGGALVVADPLDDLPAARREGAEVAATLAAAGVAVTRLEGRAATSAAVIAALSGGRVSLLHYAGHAELTGRDGWESGLPLAAGGRLTVGDILALERAPDHVVLSGCDTARTQDTARAEGLGLAQAFAVAGASAVVASVRPVDDRLTRRLMGSLYRDLAARRASVPDLGLALREAQREAAADAASAGWESFRVIAR
jgi:tetratricopeptide (TPR) repeat protein